MKGQSISGLEPYWFFNNVEKKVRFNKHFIIVTGNTVSCSLCKTDLPISVIKTEAFKEEFALFCQHITAEEHLQNVLNYIVNRFCPSIWDVHNQYKIVQKNVLYCLFCDGPVLSIVDIEQAAKDLEIHVCGKKHQQKLQNMRMLSSAQQKNVTATTVDYTQNQSKASASGTISVPSTLCSVCECQIEILSQDISLWQDLHKQSEEHYSACRDKLRQILAKREQGNNKNLLEELFQIYPELYDQLEYCDLFKDIVYYFLCSVCGKLISNSFQSINDEIYEHLCSFRECESKYLSKIIGEVLGNKYDTETRVAEKKNTNNLDAGIISELFQSLPHLKSSESVISTVGNSLYCNACSCNITTYANQLKTLKNLKLHLETIHFENLLNKVFAQLPETLQFSKQFMYYKDNFIMCSLCDIAGLTFSPVKCKETATSVTWHLNGKQHQYRLEKWLATIKSDKSPSVNTNPLTETTDTFKGHMDNLTGHLLSHKQQELATLLKKNSKFLQIHHMGFMCILCDKKIGDIQKIKDACNTIVVHFQSKKHIMLMNNTSENVSLWKVVYDHYVPDLIRSNESYIQRVGDKFRCIVCSFDISEEKVENVIEQLLNHVSSEQHELLWINIFANWSDNHKFYQ